MRCLTVLAVIAVVVLLGLTGYNFWQIKKLNQELMELKAQVQSSQTAESTTEQDEDLVAAILEVTAHTSKARKLLSDGDSKGARAELEKSLQGLENAARLSRDASSGAAKQVGSSWDTVKKQIDELWKEVARQSEKRRPEGHEPANNN
ncbi:MAG TPA: hypothetical protein PLZ21_07765 [Armatimonadota bacterium]|jgi:CHASE3 domain sensor protein|nr:hypothetical protein [Armatimonadota bacterium]HOP80442.1 hypothetical protein [Armatimonadota bacterium]